MLPSSVAAPAALCALAVLSFACDADEVGKQCVAADLIGQCPVGSNPVLGAQASEGCGGTFDGSLVTQDGSVTGQCNASGSCQFLCQFAVPCTCGVATITKDEIVCSECPDQTCGDSRCEGTERAACEPGAGAGCFACPEDCAGPSCGDGDCTGSESPTNCPQDCAGACQPNDKSCLGSKTRVCKADGSGFDEFDCAGIGLACAGGNCVQPGVCGNGLCDVGESAASCAQDCASTCTPSAARCAGNILYVCRANGSGEDATDCATSGQVCAGSECRPANVCGNQLCESGEDALSCAQDCGATCGNDVCENGEDVSCPADCVVCGDGTCGAGEIEGCPQDCGICVPSEKQCLGLKLRVCNANGTAYDDVDCAGFALVCGGGDCVQADVCGNDLCDGDESADTCAADCGTVCGDDVCEGAETFRSCSVDCDPVCGDGTCEGLEDFASCAFDCLAGCGDGACGDLEDRGNCPADCGFCGDGTCQDGFETARFDAPANQETCVSDCVVSGCRSDGDCDDGVACTTNRCVQDKCVYTASDDLCTGDDKCIRFHGCCADDDGDGYADEACGGSDCNDADPDTHPGAPEVCGGGDTNCSGAHAPRLLPVKRLTNTPSAKRAMKVQRLANELLVTWTGVPTNVATLELVTVSEALVAGSPVSVDGIEVDVFGYVATAYHAGKAAIGAMWPTPRSQTGYLQTSQGAWVSLDGTVLATSQDIPYAGQGFCAYDTGWLPVAHDGIVHGTDVIFAATAVEYRLVPNLGSRTYGWWELGPTGTLTPIWNDGLCSTVSPSGGTRLLELDGLVTGLANPYPSEPPIVGGLINVDLDKALYPTVAPIGAEATTGGGCALGEDGDLLVLVCQKDGAITYNRVTQGGGVFYSAVVQTGAIEPLGVGRSRGNGPAMVGVATVDSVNNLWFFQRSQDGEKVLDPAIISGGGEVTSAWVMHDGTDFLVLWLAKTGGFEQVYGQRITCE